MHTGDRRAIVLGAGIAGLAAANGLARAGYRVELFERARALSAAGAALSLWSNAAAALRRLGVDDAILATWAPIAAFGVAARDGGWLIRPVAVTDARLPTRTALQNALLDALPDRVSLLLGRSCVSVGQDGGQAWVTLADGTTSATDIVVDASGIRSTCADDLLGNAATHRGYGGVLAISDRVRTPLDGVVREYWANGERFGLFDVGDDRRYAFYMRDEKPGTPPPSLVEIARRAEGWAPEIGEAFAACDQARLVPFSIHARAVPERLGRGRILCVGDAAHAMEPNLGQGGCLALEDAAILGALAAALPAEALLPAFERLRLARIAQVMRRSASAGRLIHGGAMAGAVGRRLLPLVPDAVNRRVMVSSHGFPERSLTRALRSV